MGAFEDQQRDMSVELQREESRLSVGNMEIAGVSGREEHQQGLEPAFKTFLRTAPRREGVT